ncbi:MAG: molybdopterin-dependent oxidoreductase [Propionibacteriaceae bacterium]|nr:molybdopterin-dependent oxidoreductase [Propionibacteriaceae bacterium]
MSEDNGLTQTLTNAAIRRRPFLKWSAALGGAAAVGGGIGFGLQAAKAEPTAPGTSRVFRSANTPECIHCALLVHVDDGKITKVTGDRQLYSPHRIKYPMKRKGERGDGEWEQISWDEALDTIAERLETIRSESGNEAFMSIGGTGNWAILSTGVNGLFSGFWNRFGGTTPLISQLCCASVTEGFNAVLGGNRTEFREEIVNARYIIAWGHNPAVSNQGYFKNITEAREKNGARLVTIDPRLSETAALSDTWIQIRPGTDSALSLGMINVILSEGLFDEPYVKNHTNAPFLVRLGARGYDLESALADWRPGDPLPVDLKDLQLLSEPGETEDKPKYFVWDPAANKHVPADTPGVYPALTGTFEIDGAKYQPVHAWMAAIAGRYTVDVVHEITGVSATAVRTVAREYAAAKPAAIMQNMAGAQRTDNGTLTVIGQIYLAALTGNIGVLGGGVNDTGGVLQYSKINPPVPLQKNPPIPGIPVTQLGQHLLEEKPHKIRCMYIAGSGVLTQYPNTNKLIEAFKQLEFVVVQEIFMTTTAKYADIVLPVTTIFEARDMIAGIRNRHIQLMEKAIEPLFESRTDHWILTQLAKRLGFGEDFDRPVDDLLRRVLEPTGVSLEQLEKGPVNPMPDPWIPFGDLEFNTPSGRIEFFSNYLQKMGFNPLLEYLEPVEAPWVDTALAEKYPLQLVNRRNHNQVNSSFFHQDQMTEIWPGQTVQLHPDDARARGIADGDKVQVFNDRGTIEAVASVTAGILRGVVSVTTGWGAVDEKFTASKLSPDKYEPISKGHTLNSSMVDVAITTGVK